MPDFVQITTTTGTREDAERIATELVSRRLAACVQIVGPIHSTFHWQGKLETAEEWLCVIKSELAKLPTVEELLKERHPYEVPELIATPIVGGSAAYLAWMTNELTPQPPARPGV